MIVVINYFIASIRTMEPTDIGYYIAIAFNGLAQSKVISSNL